MLTIFVCLWYNQPDMRFVQNFTPPDFRLKFLHCQFHLISTVLVSIKHKKMSENGEIYTAGKTFKLLPAVTAWTNLTSAISWGEGGNYQLSIGVLNDHLTQGNQNPDGWTIEHGVSLGKPYGSIIKSSLLSEKVTFFQNVYSSWYCHPLLIHFHLKTPYT